MDFLDPKKKRIHRQRLFIGYALVAIALGIATQLLVYAANGYGVDRKTGQIIQNGLLFVDSHPDTTHIYINNEDRGTTDNRYVLEEGGYNLELRRDGYRTWKHAFQIEGGIVERFIYPFLFPSNLTVKDINLLAATPDVASASPDRHWVVTHLASAPQTFSITDTSDKNAATTSVQIPATVLPTRTNQVLKVVEWSTDNRHLLIQATYDGGQDFIIFDRDTPASSVNLTQIFGKNITRVALRDKKFDQYYLYAADGGVLTAGDLKARTTTPMLTNVLEFWPYEDNTILYATTDGAAANKVLVKLRQDDKTYVIRDVPAGQHYLLNMASFDSHLYLVAGVNTEGKAYVYKDVMDDLRTAPSKQPLPLILLKTDNPEFVSFSANARFIAIQGGSKFAVYDAEDKRQIRYDSQIAIPAGVKAEWMDGHRLSLPSDGKLAIFDFDGTNKQILNTIIPGFAPMFDRDYEFMFTISPSQTVTDKPALVRIPLKLENSKL